MKIFFAVMILLFSITLNANGFNFASNYIPIGINAGYGGNGLVLGGELSFVHLGNGFFMDYLSMLLKIKTETGFLPDLKFSFLLSQAPLSALRLAE